MGLFVNIIERLFYSISRIHKIDFNQIKVASKVGEFGFCSPYLEQVFCIDEPKLKSLIPLSTSASMWFCPKCHTYYIFARILGSDNKYKLSIDEK